MARQQTTTKLHGVCERYRWRKIQNCKRQQNFGGEQNEELQTNKGQILEELIFLLSFHDLSL